MALQPNQWVSKYANYLYSFAYKRLLDKELAEDLVQETFLAAYKNKDSFEGRSSEKTWLTSIIKRKIIDEYRKKNTPQKNEYVLSDFFQDDDSDAPGFWIEKYMPTSTNLASTEIDTSELRKTLEYCIQELPDKHKSVFLLKNIEEWESSDISKELNISESNLWVLLHRARIKLQECISLKWL